MSADAYTPGQLTAFLSSAGYPKGKPLKKKKDNEVNADLEDLFKPSKQTKLKAKKTPTQDLLAAVKKSQEESQESKNSKKRKRNKDVDLVVKREQSLQEADAPSPKKKAKKLSDISTSGETLSAAALGQKHAEKEGRTVFVGNLPISIDKKKLKKLFSECGAIASVRLRSAAPSELKTPKKVVVITKKFHPDRHNINGYVVFKKKESVEKGLTMNGTEVDGFHIRVDRCRAVKTEENQHQHSRSVFVGNLPFDAEEEPLREHFSECGEIENVRIIRDKKTSLGKGFGYVLFKDRASVELAMKMHDSEFQKRKLRVQRSTQTNAMKAQRRVEGRVEGKKPKKVSNHDTKANIKKFSKPSNIKGAQSFKGMTAVKAEKFKKKAKLIKRAKKKKVPTATLR